MTTGLFVFCFILAGAIFSSHAADVQTSPLNASWAFLTKDTYYMKYRDYWDDWVFFNFKCVSRWGGNDKRPSDPIKIQYYIKNYDKDPYGHQYEIKVLFYRSQMDKFYYNRWRWGKEQQRQLLYIDLEKQCHVTKTFYNDTDSGCTLWMGYYKVDKDPPDECKKVYDNCGGSTKVQYHENCKYKPPEPKRH
uniref:Putative secreted protein n=1 Tax=Ixodes ricinus TaxID=34613 RepID=V5HHR5_IXORI